MREQAQNGKFRSDHLYLVAFLRLRGHAILDTERSGKFTVFVFERTPALDTDVAEFHSGGLVPAREYALELLAVKKDFIPRPGEMERWRKHEMARS